jgi:hypothetical protein
METATIKLSQHLSTLQKVMLKNYARWSSLLCVHWAMTFSTTRWATSLFSLPIYKFTLYYTHYMSEQSRLLVSVSGELIPYFSVCIGFAFPNPYNP